MQTLDKYPEIT